uniref:Uncharacterized protein n=1 Tax=Setaria italica TaxID=4555 RepID=K3YF71_SETIT
MSYGAPQRLVIIIQASLYIFFFSLCISYAISFDINISMQKMFSR